MTPKLREIVDVLDRSRAALWDAAEDLQAAELYQRPRADAWSAGEILHHVSRSEAAVAGLLIRSLPQVQTLPPDPSPAGSVLGSLDAFGVAEGRGRIESPDFTRPSAGLTREKLVCALDTSRASLLSFVRSAGDRDLHRLVLPHPALGPLDAFQWVLFCAHHDTRHARQLVAARAVLTGATAA